MKDSLTKLFGSHLVNLKMLPNCPVIVDVGACVGDFIRDIQKHIEKPLIYAIEPNKKNIDELRARMIYPDLFIFNAALVGEKELKEMKFYEIQGLPEWGNVTGLYTSKKHKSYMVKTFNLRYLLEGIPEHTIHYMKMDIEGSEWDVVNDMNEETAERIQQISLEIHCHSTKIIAKLERLGYDVFFENGELYGVRK